jgi:hypothetical protein
MGTQLQGRRAKAIWRGYRERDDRGPGSAIRDRISDLSRLALSWAPRLGVFRAPQPEREGISAIVRVSKGEEWVEPSIRSIGDFADEIIVLEHNLDAETRASVERCRGVLGNRMKVISVEGVDFFQLSNVGIKEASCRWVFRWDADFVARTSGKSSIHRLREFLLGLDRRRFFRVRVAAVELDGDLFHQIPDRRVRFDPEVFSLGGARYVAVRKGVQRLESLVARSPERWRDFTMQYDTLKVPKYYQVITWDTPCLFHVNVKSAEAMLFRYYWLEWLGQDWSEYPTVESFVRSRIGPEVGTDDLCEAASRYVNEYVKFLGRCEHDQVGDYPEVLESYLEDPRYQIVYRGGRIAGRNDTLIEVGE